MEVSSDIQVAVDGRDFVVLVLHDLSAAFCLVERSLLL